MEITTISRKGAACQEQHEAVIASLCSATGDHDALRAVVDAIVRKEPDVESARLSATPECASNINRHPHFIRQDYERTATAGGSF